MQAGMDLPHKKLSGLHPVEIARITDAVSYHQGAEIIASLDDTLAADTLEEIVAERQADIRDLAGLGFLRRFDKLRLHAHLLVAHGVGDGG